MRARDAVACRAITILNNGFLSVASLLNGIRGEAPEKFDFEAKENNFEAEKSDFDAQKLIFKHKM